jgi:ribosomal protein L37AE/L43A
MEHLCPECATPTVYQVFSGGREWFCENCEATGHYPQGQAPRRARMLQTEEGRTALRAEMDQHLAGLRDQPWGRRRPGL